ncbi:hypothetical protein PIB30_063392 [Stylosanthes scabra]|uniref:Uncharacterized protein n=1 Tax=Stylosanthes scabra TaxID=79078 RepID=A0ABU6YNA1_9FABA|nr:hypothetical protein [Stylosanthes scabra]
MRDEAIIKFDFRVCRLPPFNLYNTCTALGRILNDCPKDFERGGRDTRFETRRCTFGDEPYSVAEGYNREGINVEMIHLCLWATFMALFFDDLGPWRLVRNIAPTRELEALGPSLRVYDPSFGLFPGGSANFRYGFRDFYNRPIIPLPPEFPEAYFSLSLVFFASCGTHFRLRLQLQAYLFFEMAKNKSCQNVRNPRVLSPAERELYGWVDTEVFTQSFVLASEHLPELRREMRLAQDLASERDYVLEAAGPSDRLPFRALEDRTTFLWVYVELFTRLGIRLPFSDFQRDVLTWCQVAVSQLHLNGWGFLRTFECGRRLFDDFEESIQEFKWHYFKVLPLPGTRPFWVDDEGRPYPWVY